jgi:hypothetical protein
MSGRFRRSTISRKILSSSSSFSGAAIESLESRRLLSGVIFQTSNTVTTSDNNGPIINSPHVVLVFWGANWGNGTAVPAAATVQSNVRSIITSFYLPDLSSYRPAFNNGNIDRTVTITTSSPAASFTGANVATMLQTNINNGTLPRPSADANYLYLVVAQNGTSSPGANGAHSFATDDQNTRFHYGWTTNNGNIDFVSNTLSHEIVEAMTDPESDAIQVDPRSSSNWNEISDGTAQNFSGWYQGVQMQSYWLQSRKAYILSFGNMDIDATAGAGGQIIVNGDQSGAVNDEFIVNKDANGRIQITINNQTISLARGNGTGQYQSVKFVGKEGADTLSIGSTVDFPVVFDGGNGYDEVYFMGNSGDDTITFNTNKPAGSTFDVFNSANIEQFNITTFDGNDTININDSSLKMNLIGGSGSNTYNINSFTVSGTSLTVFGGDEKDVVNVAPGASAHAISSPVTVHGNGGDDDVYVGPSASPASVIAAVTFDGEDGNDTLYLGVNNADAINANVTFDGGAGVSGGFNKVVYNDTGAAYRVEYDVRPTQVIRTGFNGAKTLTYSNVGNIEMSGGSDSDIFTIRNGVGSITANGNGGDDLFTFGDGMVAPLGGVTFNGGPGIDTIAFDDRSQTSNRLWDILPDRVIFSGIIIFRTDGFESVSVLAGTGADTITLPGGVYPQSITVDAGGGSDSVAVNGTLITSLTVRGGTDSVADYLKVDDRNIPTNMSGGSVYADRISRIVDEPTPSDVYYSGFSSVDWYQQDSQNSISVLGVSSDIGANNSFYILGGAFDDIVDVYPRDAAGNATILGNLYFDGGAGPNWLQLFATGSIPVGYRVFQQFGLNDVFISTISAGAAWIGATTSVQNVAMYGGAGNDFFRVDQYKAGSALSIYGGGGFDTCTIGGGNLAANITNIAAFTFDGQNGNATFVVDNSDTTNAWNYRINDPSLSASQSGGYFVGLTAKNIKTQKVLAGYAGDVFDVDAVEAGVDTELRSVVGLKLLRMGSTSGTVQTIRGKVTFLPGLGGGYMQISNNADTTADTVHLTATTLGAFAGDNLFGAGGSLVFDNIVNGAGSDPGINLLLSSGPNVVYAQPLASARVNINSHPFFVAPSGSIKLGLAGVTNPIVNGDAVAGSLTSSNRQTLSWNRFAGAIDTDTVAPAMVAANINLDGIPPAPGPGPATGPLAAPVGNQLSLDVRFSEDVSGLLSTAWLELTHVTSNTLIARSNMAVAYDSATRTARFTFPGYPNGVLPDGNYHGRILAGLPDFFGNALAADAPFDFFFLNGDANRDRTVGFNDLVALAQNYNSESGSWSHGDFNYDAKVDFVDLVILAQNYNKSLAPPAPQAGAAVLTADEPEILSRERRWPRRVFNLAMPVRKPRRRGEREAGDDSMIGNAPQRVAEGLAAGPTSIRW